MECFRRSFREGWIMQIWRKKSVEQTIAETMDGDRHLKRTLNAWDLAVMGVAVAVGAGIFSVGAQAAAFHAGPAVIISFIIAGIVCGTAAMCYAEFASMIPVAGSAYTFTYTTVGELIAWIIGWDMILEMLMAGSVIAKYWGVYLNDLMHLF
ncbi:amino acid permease, partial [Gardnerella vaginalis]